MKTIIILGGGVGGIATANELGSRLSPEHKIVLNIKIIKHFKTEHAMKKTTMVLLLFFGLSLVSIVFQGIPVNHQGSEPWTKQQLLEPSDLAEALNKPISQQPIVYSIGPQAIIKNSLDIGRTLDKDNLEKLKLQLGKLPEDADIVIYCGCCPFDRCPNIRPAFRLLNEMKFKNHKLLNLPYNIKVDWIDKGYPVNE